ncbi:MAG: tubulin-like doman-containing protein [Turicibacter sp.]|nr:tubulin-like doman-containing protein [Turicibacter sp.]
MQYSVLSNSDMKELNVLVSNNLGIVSKNSSSHLREDSKVLVIGLGGMGQETVCRLKSTLTKNIGTLDPNLIQFLILDTAANELSDRLSMGDIDEGEFISLHSEQLQVMFDNREFMPQEIKDIIGDDFRVNLDGSGANQVRLAGRVTLSEPSIFKYITEKLRDTIKYLRMETAKNLYIYIVAGIGGGTGSGLIVDFPYLVRHICEEMGLRNTKIMGNIFLPNVHRGQFNISYVYRNGYAALKEIDYYMNIKDIGETYTQQFPGLAVSSHENIFDRCTLIGGEILDIPTTKNRERAVKTCVENLMSLVTKPKSEDDVFFVDSFLNNQDAALGHTFGVQDPKRFPRNANYVYCGVGAASLYFPNVPILEYLVGSVYNKMTERLIENADKVTQKEVDEFEAALEIDPKTLIKPLLRRFGQYVEREIDKHTIIKDNIKKITSNIELVCRSQMPNFRLESYKQFVGEVISICSRKANAIFENPDKGPYYLAKIIESSGNITGLLKKFRGYWAVAEYIKSQTEKDYSAKKLKLEEIMSLMMGDKGGLFKYDPFRANLVAYKETLKEICMHELEIKLVQTLTDGYFKEESDRFGLNHELKACLLNDYLPFCDIVRHLDGIMKHNVNYNKNEIFDVIKTDNLLSLDDPIFQNIKDKVSSHLQQEIESYNGDKLNTFTFRFLGEIINNKDDWRMTEERVKFETRCVKSFREFVKDSFEEYSRTSLSRYLELAYGDESQQVKARLAHEIINTLFNKASVAYNTWSTMSLANIPTLEFKYVTLPESMSHGTNPWSDVFKPAISSQRMNRIETVYSPDENTISCYDLYACLPLWMHLRIKDYEIEYYKHMASGIHTNESANMNPPYIEYPSPFIKEAWEHSGVTYVNLQEEEYCQKLQYAFDLGIEYGIIEQEERGFSIEIFDIPGLPQPTFDLIKKDGTSFEMQPPEEPLLSEIKAFVQTYIADPKNAVGKRVRSENLYKALCEKFGKVSKEIQPNHPHSGGLLADNKENAILLLRKQMRLMGELFSTLSALQFMHNMIDAENKK